MFVYYNNDIIAEAWSPDSSGSFLAILYEKVLGKEVSNETWNESLYAAFCWLYLAAARELNSLAVAASAA